MRLSSAFRYRSWGICTLLLLLLPAFAGFGGIAWEFGQFAGLVALVGCIVLCGAPLRARATRPATQLALRPHTLVGWAALIALLMHIGCLLLADRITLEYLKPSMPVYQWSGVLGGLFLLLLCVSAVASARRRLWASHRAFQASHVIVAVGLLLLAVVHVVGTARYVGNWPTRILLAASAVGALALLMRSRRGVPAAPLFRGWRQGVFGRHALAVGGTVLTTALLLTAVTVTGANPKLREPLAARSAGLPLDFPHVKHTAVPCATCHHNFVDETGLDNCIACHQSRRVDLKLGVEARFHSFCLQCHRHPAAMLERHGPVDGCKGCHHPPA